MRFDKTYSAFLLKKMKKIQNFPNLSISTEKKLKKQLISCQIYSERV